VVGAPFGGVVSRVWIEVGHLASPITPLLTLIDPRDLWVSADIADEDAAKVRLG
jgi:multidrug resistance efflux pump